MQRIEVLRELAKLTTKDDLFVGSIGNIWDDWWNLRPGGPEYDSTFFPGILGSVASTALGLAVALPHRRVICIDTDGSLLMNTGILCTLGCERQPNLTHIVMDNGLYENIGGPVTHSGRNTDLALMARGGGVEKAVNVHTVEEFVETAKEYLEDDEMGYINCRIAPGREPWPIEKRKPTDGVEDKYRFIRHVERLEGIVIHPGAVQN